MRVDPPPKADSAIIRELARLPRVLRDNRAGSEVRWGREPLKNEREDIEQTTVEK